VTGSPRSGSTWVGNILGFAPNTGYVHEPFNRAKRPGVCRVVMPTNYVYVTAENEAAYLPSLTDTLGWRYALGPAVRALRNLRDAARRARDSRDNIAAFKRRLDAAQIARIRTLALDVWPDFYADSEW
jgi:hypothetical protein